MQGKKRYFVVVLFLLLGLTTFTFASPREFLKSQKPKNGTSEKVSNDTQARRSYAEAVEAVETAEEYPTLENVENARAEIRNADDATEQQITQLQNRVNVVEETIDVAALVKEVETLAEIKETRQTAKEKYPNAETEVKKLDEGEVKENLEVRLEKVLRLLNDTTSPKISGVTNGSIVNKSENIYVSDEFLFNVKITGPNSKGEVVTKEFDIEDFSADENNGTYTLKYKANYEGEWTVFAEDKAGNVITETFKIDKTAAKKSAVNANVNGYKNEVKEQYAINGNTVTAYISVNEELKANPTFTFYTNGKEVKVVGKEDVVASVRDSGEYPYVYTAKLAITEELVAEDGEITFHVTDIEDKAGNKTDDITKMSVGKKVLTLDRTPNRITFTTIATDNKNVDGKVYYVTEGDTVTFRMGVREKFSENPTVKIGGKEVTLEYVKYFEQPNHHEYRGTIKLDETIVDGTLDITIAGSKDVAGNVGFYYQTNGKKVLNTITKQETTNGRSLVYDNTAPIAKEVLILSKGENYKYAKNGDTIRFLIRYTEEVELSDEFSVTFNNQTKKLVRSGDKSQIEYIAEFKIANDEENLPEGLLTFEVKGAKDKLGNASNVVTTANHYKYNSVTYDRTLPVVSEGNTIKVSDNSETVIKVYKKGNDTPIAEVTGNEINIENYDGGVYTIVVVDAAGNETITEIKISYLIESLEDLNAALTSGGEATLGANINITDLVENLGTLELDLNGYELALVHEDGETGNLISNKGKLTIKNGSIKSDNINAKTLIRNEEGAELTFDNVEYTDNAGTNSSSIVNKGKLNITNSIINGTTTTNGNTLINNAGDITLKNTQINAHSVRGYAANIWSGNVLVEDCNLDTERGGLAILGGNVTINNTNIDSAVGGTNWRALYITDGTENIDVNVTVNGGNYVGYRDCVYVGHNDLANIKVTINDGNFSLNKGPKNEELFEAVPKAGADKKFEVTVKGGKYVATKLGNLENYIAEGYRINSEGRIVKENAISTKAEMVSAIAEGGKFELDTDLTLTDTSLKVAKNKDVEINLNGKTITARSTNSSASNAIEVSAGGNLKLTGNGKIEFTAGSPDTDWGEGSSKPYPGYASNTIVNRGTLVIDGPTIVNNTEYGGATYAVDAYAGSKLTLISGEISAPYNRAIRMFTSSETPSTDVTIKGGKVTGNIPLYVHVAGSNSSIAPTVNLNVSGGEIGTLGGWSLYTYSYGNSFKNINVTITGGDFYGTVAFSGGKKVDKENVSITGGKFHSELGRYLADDGWEDITKPE